MGNMLGWIFPRGWGCGKQDVERGQRGAPAAPEPPGVADALRQELGAAQAEAARLKVQAAEADVRTRTVQVRATHGGASLAAAVRSRACLPRRELWMT